MAESLLFDESWEYDPITQRRRPKLVAPVETPASHRSDPQTSRDAEHSITASGVRSVQQRAVLSLIQLHPGLTAGELAMIPHPALPADERDRYYAIQRRVSELAPEHVRPREESPTRLCRRSKRRATTIWPK